MGMGLSKKSRKIPMMYENEGKLLELCSCVRWVGSCGIQLFLQGRIICISVEKVEFWGADHGGWSSVEVGHCGSLFQGASVYSGKQEARRTPEGEDGQGGARGKRERSWGSQESIVQTNV